MNEAPFLLELLNAVVNALTLATVVYIAFRAGRWAGKFEQIVKSHERRIERLEEA